MHYVINTGGHWWKMLIFAQIDPFWSTTKSTHDKNNFEKLLDNSREVWFILLGNLIVFISWLDYSFIREVVKKIHTFRYFLYIYIEKSCKNTLCVTPANKLRKVPNWGISWKLKCHDTAGLGFDRNIWNYIARNRLF